ncbi:MAG: hypothetical protein LBL45_10145 [Treponema sp.]|nr:hypothetical protein [Treponema sp.]
METRLALFSYRLQELAKQRGEEAVKQERLRLTRDLASRGLNDTRETLRLIRKIQEPYHKSVETIYQLKKIFEEVTGITVAIELGEWEYNSNESTCNNFYVFNTRLV